MSKGGTMPESKILIELSVTDTSILDDLEYDIRALVEGYYIEEPTEKFGPKPEHWVESFAVKLTREA